MTSVDETTEAEALQALADGDRRRALTLLMNAYGTAVYRVCRAALGDEAAAEDAMQTVFIEAHAALGRFAGRSSLLAWLLGIARHRCLDALKSRRRWWRRFTGAGAAGAALEPPDARPLPDERLADQALTAFLLACLDELPPEVRLAVLLRCQQGLSFEDMGQLSRERPGTLQARVARALPVLRACVKGKEAGHEQRA